MKWVQIRLLLALAYDVRGFQLVGGPAWVRQGWMGSNLYDRKDRVTNCIDDGA